MATPEADSDGTAEGPPHGADSAKKVSTTLLHSPKSCAALPILTCSDLQHLCEQLRSNLDVAFQRHCEDLAVQCAMSPNTLLPPPREPVAGLSQNELDALAVATPRVKQTKGDCSPHGAAEHANGTRDGTDHSRCSSARCEPICTAPCPGTPAVFHDLRNVAGELDKSPQPETHHQDSDSCGKSIGSTRSSSSPSHMRDFRVGPLSDEVDDMSGSGESRDDYNSGPGSLSAPVDMQPPGIVLHQKPTSVCLEGSPSLNYNMLTTPSNFAGGVGLEDSPIKETSGPNFLLKRLSPGTPGEESTRMPMCSSLSLDAIEHSQYTRKAVVISPLSKRKRAMNSTKLSWLQRMVKTPSYELASAAFIMLNVIFIALETDLRASFVSSSPRSAYDDDMEETMYSFIAANVFCAVFVLDLLLRIHSERMSFFLSRERGWNTFDIVVVLTAVIEVIVHWYEMFSGTTSFARAFLRRTSMLRIIRLMRVVTHCRNVRVIRFIRELRLMVFSLTGTLKSLMWAIVLMVIVLLVFGVFFTDGAITYLVEHPSLAASTTADLRAHFGSLSSAIVSLYMAMSGGEDWGGIWHVLEPLPHEYQGAFLAFITFAILALLNVVTAVFVEAAMQVSQNDKELVVMEEIASKGEFVSVMQQVFAELDTNDSGALSLEEFEKHIEDEKLTAFLSSFGLDVSQVRTLFTLLDVDRTGEVDLDEFVSGCLRLKGGAKSLDMAILKYQVEWILHNIVSWEKKFLVLANADPALAKDPVT